MFFLRLGPFVLPSKRVGSTISLSRLSLYRWQALSPRKWNYDPSSVWAPGLPVPGFSANYLTNVRNTGADAPDGVMGCYISEASTIIFLAYISLLICETSGSSQWYYQAWSYVHPAIAVMTAIKALSHRAYMAVADSEAQLRLFAP